MMISEAQRAFAKAVGDLLQWAYAHGYEITLGEAWRSTATARIYAEQGKGIANSLHCDRLAIDLNLWKGGQYTADPEDYRALGDYWKTLNDLSRWGGDFARKDGDHFSFAWDGRE